MKIAYLLFLSKGYENTSVDDIINEAGIAKGTYYYYFESKEKMLEEVIDMMLDGEIENAKAAVAAEIPVPMKIVGVIASLRPSQEEQPITDTLHRPENIFMHEKINRRLIEKAVPLLSEVTEEGIRQGLFSCDHIPERVRVLLILSNALFNDEGFGENDIEVFIDVAEKLLGAQTGTMGFIRQLINTQETQDE